MELGKKLFLHARLGRRVVNNLDNDTAQYYDDFVDFRWSVIEEVCDRLGHHIVYSTTTFMPAIKDYEIKATPLEIEMIYSNVTIE